MRHKQRGNQQCVVLYISFGRMTEYFIILMILLNDYYFTDWFFVSCDCMTEYSTNIMLLLNDLLL